MPEATSTNVLMFSKPRRSGIENAPLDGILESDQLALVEMTRRVIAVFCFLLRMLIANLQQSHRRLTQRVTAIQMAREEKMDVDADKIGRSLTAFIVLLAALAKRSEGLETLRQEVEAMATNLHDTDPMAIAFRQFLKLCGGDRELETKKLLN